VTTVVPGSPSDLYSQLIKLFPGFEADLTREEVSEAGRSFHGILLEFCQYLGGELARGQTSDCTLQSLGALINGSVASGGDLENAFGTCLLEHLHRIRATKTLWPFLSKESRERTVA
jgi:hypothetical protein